MIVAAAVDGACGGRVAVHTPAVFAVAFTVAGADAPVIACTAYTPNVPIYSVSRKIKAV